MSDSEMMRWDLAQLVEFDDPAYIEERMTAAVAAAEEMRDKYRGRVGKFTAKELLDMLKELESVRLRFEGPLKYARLMYDADMSKEVAKKLYGKFMQTQTKINQALAFSDLEIGALLKENPEIKEDPMLEEYRHFLFKIERRIPHMLSEKEEELTIAKNENGIRAWYKLHGDWLATRKFDIEIDGEVKTLPYGKMLAFYQSPNRDLRKRSHEVVYKKLGEDNILWSSALKAVCADHLTMTKLRNWDSPMTQSFIANDVDAETIQALMNVIAKNVQVYQDYLKLKAKVLGLDVLGNWDIDAPLPNTPEKEYSWDEARQIVTEGYKEFDGEVGEWIEDMYEKRHIDGEVREGKRSGAYCMTWHKGESAYILQSFNGILNDLFTQAHELGHAMHAHLGTRAQTPFNYQIGMCVAETGSIFGELLLVEKLLSTLKTKEEKQAVLASVLDEFGSAAFQVSTRVWFETLLYEAIEDGIALDGEKVSELWVKARTKMYGDAVEWLPEMRWWWTMKLHFFIPDFRYYNYPYVYAQLFVYVMYRLYKEQGKEFVPKLKALLAAGSSKSPRDLAAEIGFDITKEEFWEKGIAQFKEFLEQFKETL